MWNYNNNSAKIEKRKAKMKGSENKWKIQEEEKGTQSIV